jgi:hypothetical protein
MNMNFLSSTTDDECMSIKNITHYLLSDGRVWSIVSARFVSSAPKDAVVGPCPDEQGVSSIEGLIACLDFYGFPKGELRMDAEYAAEAREKRNQLIAETDFMAMPDYPLDNEKKAAILAYRQALRDVPEQAGFPRQIDWPVKP